MNQIAQYLRRQLSALHKQIQRTPPKKHTSLAKIQSLVRTAPIDSKDKQSLQKQIKQVQAALTAAWTPSKTVKSTPKRNKGTSSHLIHMSQEPKGVRDLLRAKLDYATSSSKNLEILENQYQELKKIRITKQKYLEELIVKVHRLERIQTSRAKSAHSFKQTQLIAHEYQQKQRELSKVKEGAVTAARHQRKQVVQRLMRKYCEGVQQFGKKKDSGQINKGSNKKSKVGQVSK